MTQRSGRRGVAAGRWPRERLAEAALFSRATRTLAGPTRIVAMSVPLSPIEREALAHSAEALKHYAATWTDAAVVG